MPERAFLASFALLALAGLMPASAGEAWEGIYEGAIGQSRIIVELAANDARYAYIGRPNDLGLIVEAKDGILRLTETLVTSLDAEAVKANPRLASGRWTLKQDGERLNGSWTSASGSGKQNVSLIRLSTQPDGGDIGPRGKIGAYSARWLATSPQFLPLGGETKTGVLSYTLVKDDLYGNVLPRLTRAPAGVRIEAVNHLLLDLHRKLVLEDRACFQGLRNFTAMTDLPGLAALDKTIGKKADPLTQTVLKLVYGSATILALLDTRVNFCGGAHPGYGIQAFTFDLVNPRQITGAGSETDPEDDLGTSGFGTALDIASPPKRASFDALWTERMRDAISKMKAPLPVAPDPDADAEAACAREMLNQLKTGGGKLSKIVYPLPEGLAIRAVGFPQYISGGCLAEFAANPVVLPWRDLLAFLKPGQKLLPKD